MSAPGTWGQGEPSSDSWPESHSLAEEGAEISCPNTAGSALREHRRSDAHIAARASVTSGRPCSSGPQHPFPHLLSYSLERQGRGQGQPCWLVFDGRGRATALPQSPCPVSAGPLPGSRTFRDCSWVLCGLGPGEVRAVVLRRSLPLLSLEAQHCWRLESQQFLHEDHPSTFGLLSTQG